jgi:hypothetical protein
MRTALNIARFTIAAALFGFGTVIIVGFVEVLLEGPLEDPLWEHILFVSFMGLLPVIGAVRFSSFSRSHSMAPNAPLHRMTAPRPACRTRESGRASGAVMMRSARHNQRAWQFQLCLDGYGVSVNDNLFHGGYINDSLTFGSAVGHDRLVVSGGLFSRLLKNSPGEGTGLPAETKLLGFNACRPRASRGG